MSFTAQNLADEALRLNGMLAAGRQASATHYSIVLDALNQLIDSLAAEGATIYQLTYETLPLSGQASYTIGPGGAWNTGRPQKIRAAAVINADGSMPCEIVAPEKWSTIVDRSVAGAFGDYLCCDYDYPLATIHVWPAAVAPGQLELWSYKPLTGFTSLASAVTLPPGYTETLKYSLAVAIQPEFPGARLAPQVPARAAQLKASLGALNAVTIGAPVPPRMPVPAQRPLTETDIEKGKVAA
jgi:hypothetical protein